VPLGCTAAGRRRELLLAPPQKSFVCYFGFARDHFFLPRLRRGFGGQVKGKQDFSVVFCSERAGGGAGLYFFSGVAEFLPLTPSFRHALDSAGFTKLQKSAKIETIMKFVKTFSQLSKSDTSIAGGKGASLGEMTNIGIPVPPGFVILANAFEQFLSDTDINVEIQAALEKVNQVDMQTVENASESIQALILRASVPKNIAEEIIAEFKKLNADFVAVRSSATAEDGSDAAWAGQLESYLNTTEATLLENVKKCWASLFTPRAIHYRFDKGFYASKVSVAVVVQKMIDSEVAGVAFSVHPVTQDQNQMLIEACYGLGEAIVSGSISPDNYVIDKQFSILDKNVLKQTRKIVRGKNGGIKEKLVSTKEQNNQKLDDASIKDLAALVVKVEKHYGFPCDIEWAMENGKLFILQSRPITTLSKKSEKPEVKENNFTHTYEQTWQVHGYTMLSMDLGVAFPFSTMKHRLCSFVDKNWFFTFENNVGSMYYSKQEMDLAGYWGRKDFLDDAWFKQYIDNSQKLYSQAEKLFQKYTEDVIAKTDKETLYKMVREMGLLLTDLYGYFNACQPQCVAYLERDLEKEISKFAPKEKVREIMLGLTRPETRTLLDEEEIEWLKLCSIEQTTDSLQKVLEEHSQKYGILGTSDGGPFYTPDYYQKLFTKRNIEESKQKLDKKLSQEKTIKMDKTVLVEKYKISELAQKLAEILATTGHERFEIRLRGWMPLDYWFTNRLLPHLEKRFGVETQLSRQFTFQELLQFLLTESYDKTELRKRDDYFVIGMRNGQVFLRSGEEGRTYAKSLLPDLTKYKNEIEGQIAKMGFVRGHAYVLHWNAKDVVKEMEEMPKGSILVAGQTRPQLMPAIRKSAAIVTDEGGITSHAAIVSRELGIPCVIGTKVATKIIKTGDLIEVDANEGVVRIAERTK
jgi:phosphohistidine swiveling domain-containing protein